MRSDKKLTRLGRLRKEHAYAKKALGAYGLEHASMSFLHHSGNTLYRVYAPDAFFCESDLFIRGQFLLRLYQPGWQTAESISLELAWLQAMFRAGLPVPEPMLNNEGSMLTSFPVNGSSHIRLVAMTRWVKGKHLPGYGQAKHYTAQGKLMAAMHAFSQNWRVPFKNIEKRRYDWKGLFMNDEEIGLQEGECWGLLSSEQMKHIEIVAEHFQALSDKWGEAPRYFGLIHGDMGLDFNVIFNHGQPRPIDFDSSGFGYWLFDLAVALVHCLGTADYLRFRDALLSGYTSLCPLSSDELNKMDLFTAVFCSYYNLWMAGIRKINPLCINSHMESQEKNGAAFIADYVKNT